jgi:hypothetical protein
MAQLDPRPQRSAGKGHPTGTQPALGEPNWVGWRHPTGLGAAANATQLTPVGYPTGRWLGSQPASGATGTHPAYPPVGYPTAARGGGRASARPGRRVCQDRAGVLTAAPSRPRRRLGRPPVPPVIVVRYRSGRHRYRCGRGRCRHGGPPVPTARRYRPPAGSPVVATGTGTGPVPVRVPPRPPDRAHRQPPVPVAAPPIPGPVGDRMLRPPQAQPPSRCYGRLPRGPVGGPCGPPIASDGCVEATSHAVVASRILAGGDRRATDMNALVAASRCCIPCEAGRARRRPNSNDAYRSMILAPVGLDGHRAGPGGRTGHGGRYAYRCHR